MNIPPALDIHTTVLLLIDFQEKLYAVMHEKEKLLRNVEKLIRGVKVLEIPIVITEQYPRGLGPTIPDIKELIPDITPVEKVCFNCANEAEFNRALESVKRRQVLVAGIESHICVYQTATALARSGYQVEVVGDCVASRDPANKLATLSKMNTVGISITTTEMVLFELLKVAEGDKFKQISNIVK